MRKLKFKVWDKDRKCFLGSEAFTNYVDPIEDGSNTTKLRPDKTILILQFTGLKDKNGKEIYEGDIFRVAGNQQYEIVWLHELQYEEQCAGWGLKQLTNKIPAFLIDTYAVKHGEVIGNIYENPKLPFA